jgi:hypothetical protein
MDARGDVGEEPERATVAKPISARRSSVQHDSIIIGRLRRQQWH